MRKLIYLAAAAVIAQASPSLASSLEPATQDAAPMHAFEDHPSRLYTGAVVSPVIQVADADYIAQIRQAARGTPNYAGRNIITSYSCGTDCLYTYIINAQNGTVKPLGLGGAEQPALKMEYRADSRLMRAWWKTTNDGQTQCHSRAYLWDMHALQPFGSESAYPVAPQAPCGPNPS